MKKHTGFADQGCSVDLRFGVGIRASKPTGHFSTSKQRDHANSLRVLAGD
jgi:hypothetical protein